jgi:phosphatidylglycerophosphate synthase
MRTGRFDVDALSSFERRVMAIVGRYKTALFSPVARIALRLGIPSGAVTLAQVPLAVVLAVLVQSWPRFAAVLWAVVILLDGLDGVVARMAGSVSLFGKLLDHFVDHLKEALLFCGLSSGRIIEPGWGLLYVFLHAASNAGLYVCNYYNSSLSFAAKPSLLTYPLVLLLLWTPGAGLGRVLGVWLRLSVVYMAVLSAAILLRLRRVMPYPG